MPKPRKLQISLEATPFYYYVSRCVRRAFLCGTDAVSGLSYEHRRHQIEHDLLRLTSIFFIDVAAFAVLSNHYHVVLHVDFAEAKAADAKDVVLRWHQLYKGKDVSRRYLNGETPVRFESRKTGKQGYSTACANEWVQGVCKKPKISCGDCRYQIFLSVTDTVTEKI